MDQIKERLKRIGSDFDVERIRNSLYKKGLSTREIEIFFKVGSGLNNREVAEQCYVTKGTIKFHLTSIFKKLEVSSRSKLVLLAHGLEPIW